MIPVSGESARSGNLIGSPGRSKKLKLAGLVLLIFYGVSGGPFGMELIVKAGGPFYTLVGFSLLLVWALPEALITAELATAMPEASGSVAWVAVAFGKFWGFQKGWLSWISGVVDNAIYPVLFIDCLVQLFNDELSLLSFSSLSSSTANGDYSNSSTTDIENHSSWVSLIRYCLTDTNTRLSIILCITALLTYLTYRGLDIVSGVSILLCVLSLSPFVVFCAVGVWYVKPEHWWRGKQFLCGMNLLFFKCYRHRSISIYVCYNDKYKHNSINTFHLTSIYIYIYILQTLNKTYRAVIR